MNPSTWVWVGTGRSQQHTTNAFCHDKLQNKDDDDDETQCSKNEMGFTPGQWRQAKQRQKSVREVKHFKESQSVGEV